MDDELKRFESAIDKLSTALSHPANAGNQSTISINAGGAAVWIATSVCAVMLAINLVLISVFIDQDRKISRLEDYLSAIYAQVPSLKYRAENEDISGQVDKPDAK